MQFAVAEAWTERRAERKVGEEAPHSRIDTCHAHQGSDE